MYPVKSITWHCTKVIRNLYEIIDPEIIDGFSNPHDVIYFHCTEVIFELN